MASPRFPARSRFVERIEAMSTRPPTLGAAVEDAVSLAMGEPFGGTPDAVVHAAVRALRSGRTRYEQLRGSPRLRDSVAAHLSGHAGSALVASHVVLAPGASAGLAATILALVIPGDKVVLPEPTYSLYADHVSMAGGHVEWMRTAEDGRLPLENLEDALQDDPTTRLACRALTVACAPADNLALQYATSIAKPGDVLVVDAKAYIDAGPWGAC